MLVEVDQKTGLPVTDYGQKGHQTIADIKKQGFSVFLTRRTIPCTEIHHEKPFCVVWPHSNKTVGADHIESAYKEITSQYRVVFGDCWLDDQALVEFELVFDEDMVKKGYLTISRRTWDVAKKMFIEKDEDMMIAAKKAA